MTRGEREQNEEAWRRANQYGNKAWKLIDGIREEMAQEREQDRIRERQRETGKG
jgi:hypothetical protein